MAIRRIGVDGTVSRQSVDLLGNRRGEVQGFNVVERDDLRIGDDLDYLGRPAVVEVVDTEDLTQLHFMQSEIGLDGILRDETPGRGTDRPELIGRCIKGDGVNDSADCGDLGTLRAVSMWVKPTSITSYTDNLLDLNGTANIKLVNGVATLAGLGSATVRTYGTIAAGGWFLLTVDFGTGISASACKLLRVASGYSNATLWDVQFFDAALSEAESIELSTLVEFALPTKSRVAWYNCESQHSTLLLDSSGNERHATCSLHTATVGNFFYQGSDVPGSYANKVGYTLSNGSSHYAYSNGTGLIAAGVVIPRNEANQTACAAYTAAGAAVSLDNIGEAPRHAQLENNNCGTFDGSNDYVEVPNHAATQITNHLSLFVRHQNSNANLATFENFINKADSTGDQRGYVLGLNSAEQLNAVISGDGTAGTQAVITATTPINPSQMKSYGFTFSNGVVKLFINGVVVPHTVSGSIPSTIHNTTSSLRLGSAVGSNFVEGQLFDARIYSGASAPLSEAQMLAVHNCSGIQFDDQTLAAWYPFSEGKGTTVHNVVPDGAHGAASGIDETLFWGMKQNVFAYNSAKGSSYDAGKYIPARNDSSGLDALGNPLTYAPSPGVWPLSEATLNSNPNNAPRRGTPGPTAFHPVSAPGSNPTFFRRRTKDSELVAIDRFVHYEETLDGARLTQAQTFTTEKPL